MTCVGTTQVTNPAPRSDNAVLSIWAVLPGKIVNHHIPYNPSSISTFMLCLDKHGRKSHPGSASAPSPCMEARCPAGRPQPDFPVRTLQTSTATAHAQSVPGEGTGGYYHRNGPPFVTYACPKAAGPATPTPGSSGGTGRQGLLLTRLYIQDARRHRRWCWRQHGGIAG